MKGSEKVIEATIRYDNFPGLIVVERLETVRVGVRGTVSKMRNLNPFAVDVFVELSNPDKGVFEVPLTSDNVFLPEDLEVVSIEPNLLTLDIDRISSEMKPVIARLAGEPSAGAVAGIPTVAPESVRVIGPASVLRRIATIDTRPVNLTGHAITFSKQSLLLSPDPLITVMDPAVVTVRVPLEIPNAPAIEGEDGDEAAETP